MAKAVPYTTIQAYIATFPLEAQTKLEQLYGAIQSSVPEAEETISYGMPSFKFHGSLVYFAAYRNHIGFYALPTGHSAFRKELAQYKKGKGSVQFPLNQSLPIDLIKEMVKFHVRENLAKEEAKKKKHNTP